MAQKRVTVLVEGLVEREGKLVANAVVGMFAKADVTVILGSTERPPNVTAEGATCLKPRPYETERF